MTTSLLIVTNGLENGTNITCRIGTNNFKTHLSSSILYFAGSYFHILQWNTVMLIAIYRCTMFKSTFNHIPREGDIFQCCTKNRNLLSNGGSFLGVLFEGFLRFAITFEVPTTVLWGRRKSLPAVWCHWLTVAVIYF